MGQTPAAQEAHERHNSICILMRFSWNREMWATAFITKSKHMVCKQFDILETELNAVIKVSLSEDEWAEE